MASYAERFEYELRKLIAERLEEQKTNLAIGTGVGSYDEYRRVVGHIAGLQDALDMCDDAKTAIEKDM